MFCKLFSLFALLAVAMAAPQPAPQYLTYSSGLDYVYPAVSSGAVPAGVQVVSPYSASYSPLTYSYPSNAYFVRK